MKKRFIVGLIILLVVLATLIVVELAQGDDEMAKLFDNDSLIDGSQITVPRYLQEGSTWKELSAGSGGDARLLYTVPAGKAYYVTDIIFRQNTAVAVMIDVQDSTAGGNTVLNIGLEATSGFTFPLHFNTPIKFSTGIYTNSNGGNTFMNYIGWLEDE